MIDFKSIIENLKEMNDYYEQHLSDIDRYLEKKRKESKKKKLKQKTKSQRKTRPRK